MSISTIREGRVSPSRAPFPPALAKIAVAALVVIGLGEVAAADGPVVTGDCYIVPLDGDTTASVGGPMALADITVCYRALPAEFGLPLGPLLRARATRSADEHAPPSVEGSGAPSAPAPGRT